MGMIALAAALAAAAPHADAALLVTEDARPAMFMVRDADTTVYIFGTFHALDGRAEWFKDRVKSSFDASGELVLETVVPDGSAPAPDAADPSPKGASTASFLATTRVVISAGRTRGMQVGKGADTVLRSAANSTGKPVWGLETPQLQFHMLSQMPAVPAASGGAESDRAQMDSISSIMADMQSAWKRGDQGYFVSMLGQLEKGSPDTYRLMFTERNARWADWIAARMRSPGTVFFAVGTGHLAGKDSLLVRLAELGIRSSRLN